MHWLVLIPCYFFAAMTLLGLFMLAARLVRLAAPINWLVGAAIAGALAVIVLPLAAGLVELRQVSLPAVLLLAAASFVAVGLDAAVSRLLPLPLDRDLEQL